MRLLLHDLTCCSETLEMRRPCVSLVITKRSMLLRTASRTHTLRCGGHTREEGAWKVSLCTTVYNVRHELAISGGEGSFTGTHQEGRGNQTPSPPDTSIDGRWAAGGSGGRLYDNDASMASMPTLYHCTVNRSLWPGPLLDIRTGQPVNR